VGLSLDPGCDESNKEGLGTGIKLQLKPGTAKAVYLKVWHQELKPMTYVLLHVISRDEQKIVGGITYIIISGKED